MYLLEYYVGEKKEQKGKFHFDSFMRGQNKDSIHYNHFPFTFGWNPVCIVPDKLVYESEMSKLLSMLEGKPYEDVVRVVTLFVANYLEINYEL